MSDTPRRLAWPPALRRRGVRSAVILAAVALVAAGISFGLARSGVGGARLGDQPVSLQQQTPGGAGAGNGGPGSPPAAGGAASSPAAGSTARASGAAHTPPPTIAPTPANQIAGTADWQTSTCGAGWDPGVPCKVYYHGTYILFGFSGAKLILTAKTPDGTVLDTQSFDAPTGGHRWGGYMSFLAPKGNEVDYQAVVQDFSGQVVMKSNVFKQFNS